MPPVPYVYPTVPTVSPPRFAQSGHLTDVRTLHEMQTEPKRGTADSNGNVNIIHDHAQHTAPSSLFSKKENNEGIKTPHKRRRKGRRKKGEGIVAFVVAVFRYFDLPRAPAVTEFCTSKKKK